VRRLIESGRNQIGHSATVADEHRLVSKISDDEIRIAAGGYRSEG
jgi:Txe/YoeB family toxin of Txe-Axe toxin-antitoxin module